MVDGHKQVSNAEADRKDVVDHQDASHPAHGRSWDELGAPEVTTPRSQAKRVNSATE
jgi:hypothetical protein